MKCLSNISIIYLFIVYPILIRAIILLQIECINKSFYIMYHIIVVVVVVVVVGKLVIYINTVDTKISLLFQKIKNKIMKYYINQEIIKNIVPIFIVKS